MWKTKTFWFQKDNGDSAETDRASEATARGYAEQRSKEVSGGTYVLRSGHPVAWYEGGIDTMAPTPVAG